MKEFEFEFIVRAKSWQEVVDIFKNELRIDKKKRNSSDRDIDGYFLVSVPLNNTHINADFYTKIRESETIAIAYDKLSEEHRNTVLGETAVVEAHLRKLLLHVSDIVDDYFQYFAKTLAVKYVKNKNIITKDEIDPLTSYLTLDEMITILGLDLSSWDKRQVNANDVLEILEAGEDLQTVKKKLRKKIKRDIVWNHISKNLLRDPTKWEDIAPNLNNLKTLRNKAAHFRVCTEQDAIKAGKLSGKILKLTRKRSQLQANDLTKLRRATYPPFAEALESARLAAIQIAGMQKDTISAMASIGEQTQRLQKTILSNTYPSGLASAMESMNLLREFDQNKEQDE